jgi:hypothetical protein
MKYLAWFLIAILALALPGSPATAQCNCANSTLMGTSATTSAGFTLTSTNTVTNAVEIPSSAGILFWPSSGPSPRTAVDYGANTIRVDFIQQAQSYTGLATFTFSNLNPTPPAGCTGTPQIVGMTVQTNRPGAGFVVSGATFGPHSVSVPYSPASITTTWQPGEYFLVTLQFGCPGTTTTGGFDPCCPPWNAAQLKANLVYQGTGGIGAPYTLRFVPSAALNTQMNTFAAYLQSLGLGFTSVTIQFQLFTAGTGPSAVPTGTPLTGSVTWTGTGTPTATFFPPGAMTAGPLGPWYRVQTTVVPNGGPGSSFFPANCLTAFVDVRLQVV